MWKLHCIKCGKVIYSDNISERESYYILSKFDATNGKGGEGSYCSLKCIIDDKNPN